jgi:hypothetical protein
MKCDKACREQADLEMKESLKPTKESQNIIKHALAMQSKTDRPFLIVMQASIGMVPMIKSWLCNTNTMKDVHKNTLIIVDSLGYKAMQQFNTDATIVQDALPKILQGSWEYGTRGYWRTTQNRVAVIGDLLRAGITMLLVEPDATWIRNVYEQDDLVGNMQDDILGMSDDAGGVGFGFLRIKSNQVVQDLWTVVQTKVDNVMGGKISEMKSTENPRSKNLPTGEQVYFNQEWQRLKKKGVLKAHTLETCRYPNGKWYDGGRGGNGANYRKLCSSHDLIVIQNNWMVGNDRKMLRAKRWDHWFLQNDGNTCIMPEADALLKAVKASDNMKPPHGAPTRKEKE